jgi:hypothetical protein
MTIAECRPSSFSFHYVSKIVLTSVEANKNVSIESISNEDFKMAKTLPQNLTNREDQETTPKH